ncbi:hypothetical protein VNI00_015855, partial [Paramarasmius palmivorus]
TRDKLDPFVATIIHQFLTSEPLRVLGPSIIEAVCSNPKIFETNCETQFEKLILEPCSKVEPEAWDNLPNVVVIDGLDECILIPSQERLITMIRKAIPQCHLIFLIASRPEPRIRQAFDNPGFASLHRLPIGDSLESSKDIVTFFHHEFAQLQQTHEALRNFNVSWPGEDVVQQLAKRACGQFIFATTVMKYIASDDDDPEECLGIVLQNRPDDNLLESPYASLDLLYCQILEKCPQKHWEELCKVLRLILTIPKVSFGMSFFPKQTVLFTVFTRFMNALRSNDSSFPCSPECIAAILAIKPEKVRTLLNKLHAVLEVPDDDKGKIHIPHATFSEFLLNHQRSKDYHVEPYTDTEYYDLVAQAYLHAISVCSKEYWHHVNNSSIAPRNEWCFISTDASLLCVFDIVQLITSPSIKLLEALDKFDPYPFVAAALHPPDGKTRGWKLDGVLRRGGPLMQAAHQVPQAFVDKLETFMPAFYILPACSKLWELKVYIEERLYISGEHQGKGSWSDVLRLDNCRIDEGNFIFMVPADRQPLPSWHAITITCETADTVEGLLDTLPSGYKGTLINDIQKDTNESKHDLYALKKLVAQRREEMGLEPFPCAPELPKLDQNKRNAINKADNDNNDDDWDPKNLDPMEDLMKGYISFELAQLEDDVVNSNYTSSGEQVDQQLVQHADSMVNSNHMLSDKHLNWQRDTNTFILVVGLILPVLLMICYCIINL